MKPHHLLTAMPLVITALGLAAATADAQSVSWATSWTTVANNGDVMPGTDDTPFNSYNQPAINVNGVVVFRARSKGGGEDGGCGCGGDAPTDGGGGEGGMTHGVYKRNMARSNPPIVRIFDRTSVVPAPNNLDAMFNEFPSVPRIAMTTNTIATRGESSPVWDYTLDGADTRTGTSGIYMDRNGVGPSAAMSQLGSIPEFSYWQVPGAAAGTRFDQFPGAPSPTSAAIVFKGNWSDTSGAAQTGVYYRTVSATGGTLPVQVIADTSTLIPNDRAKRFGSTAPPSAAGREMVFVGLDNEETPGAGGIYMARLTPRPPLTTLVGIGDPVPGVEEAGAIFNKIGEGLSFDGRYVSFWGAWGAQTRTIELRCPTTGNAARRAYCLKTNPGGVYVTEEPLNQGIFVTDTVRQQTVLVARTGGTADDDYLTFLYWVYSGKPPGTGGGDFEPARWRSSAFTAVTAAGPSFQVAFKATKEDGTQGVYLASGPQPRLDSHPIVVDTTMSGAQIDPEVNGLGSPTPLMVTAVGLERDGFRNRRLVLAIGMASDSANWAGIYLAAIP